MKRYLSLILAIAATVSAQIVPSTGNVRGPTSATDNAVARYDGTTGKLIQNSAVTIDDSGNATFAGAINLNANGGTASINTTGATGLVQISTASGNNLVGLAIKTNKASSLYGAYLDLDTTSATNGRRWAISSNGDLDSAGIGSLQFLDITAGVTALKIDSSQNATFSGQVNSGTSTSSGYNNNYNAQLEGAVGRIIINKDSASSSGTIFAGFGRNGSGLGSITQDGTTGVLYNTTSDARLKENVRDVTNSGAIIDGLKPRVFDWKNHGDKDRFGFLAQEVHAVFPQAVKKGDDGEEVTDAWAMDAAKLVPVLVAELKTLRARVAALEAARK